MHTAHGYAAHSRSTPLVPHTFRRRDLQPNDVRIDILFCGVCHSDIKYRFVIDMTSLGSGPRSRPRRHEAII